MPRKQVKTMVDQAILSTKSGCIVWVLVAFAISLYFI